MLSEIIKFTYVLNVSNLTVPVAIGATLNDTVVGSAVVSANGKFELPIETTLLQGPANLTLLIGDLLGASITVSCIRLTWIKDNSNLDPMWFLKQ